MRIAVLPYFPYSRQSKKKSNRGAITARMLANLLGVAGVKHVITVDLHASQMQGFFKCPVDNLHAEPIIAKWIRRNVPKWQDAVVVSKNAGGTKRVTSLADALKLNFGMITTDRKRHGNNNSLTASAIMAHFDGVTRHQAVEVPAMEVTNAASAQSLDAEQTPPRTPRTAADSRGSPANASFKTRSPSQHSDGDDGGEASTRKDPIRSDSDYDDCRAQEVIHGRLIRGHIVADDAPSPSNSITENSNADDDVMTQSQVSSFFAPEKQSLGGSGDRVASSDEEDNALENPQAEHMVTLVGNVKNRMVFIVDDMIDKPNSWIAAAETVVKKGGAKKVYCIATHGVFGGDCLEQLQGCECIDAVVVTNSFPIEADRARQTNKLTILDLSSLLSEAIRRNHYGESISPLYLHGD